MWKLKAIGARRWQNGDGRARKTLRRDPYPAVARIKGTQIW